ncbi:hypothetical protein [Dongia rigui]|uniref:Uncharacterized protein n=1 Tax=Dongia rigui TaxID=940149 RepID=A0ABU5E5N0_9PROT|nr:hypothetical protein [Dongia rigui]MDY0874372.1 hypothetical protein [Dongia rigui]
MADGARSSSYGGDIWDVMIAALVLLVVIGIIGWIIYFGVSSEKQANCVLILVMSGVLGWGAGILATPYTAGESKRLLGVGKTVSAILTGYLLGKIDRVVDAAVFGVDGDGVDGTALQMVAIAVSSFITTAVVTYVTRSYVWTKQRGT